jgi:HK97 family phage portal protein
VGLFRKKENRDNLTKWMAWLDSMGGSESASGVVVSESSSMTSSAVLACLRVLSTTMAMLPFPLYRRLNNGGKEKAFDHPLYYLLHDSPNNYQTAYEFRQQMLSQVLLHGNFYALIERDPQTGDVTEILPFADPSKMEVALFADEPRYRYTLESGKVLTMGQDKVLHIKGMSTNGLIGLDLLDSGKDNIGLTLAMQTYASKFFKSGGNISGTLEHPGSLSEDAAKRLRLSWDKAYSGVSNAHKVAILEEGMKYSKIGATPEEAQALESRKFQTIEVCRIFGVPPHMIGDLERATFSNIEHQSIEFVTFCIAPWAKMIEQRVSKQLLDQEEKRRYFAEFTLSALMRGDYKSRQEGLNIMRQNGIINANEWRELENFNPIEGEEGSIYLVNGNMIKPGETPDDPPPDDKADRALGVIMDDALSRIIRREESDVMRQYRKKPGEIKSWLFDFYQEHESYMIKNLEPVFRALSIAKNSNTTGEMMEYIEKHRKDALEKLNKAVDDGVDLQTVFDEMRGGLRA